MVLQNGSTAPKPNSIEREKGGRKMGKEEREGDRRRTRKEEKKEGRIADTALRIALGTGRWACGRLCLSKYTYLR